jgi:hypothetical protein
MKVFLSWSGPTSKGIALALHDWLPSVIQTVKPWMSSEDIKKGARWSSAIAKGLAESRAAIFCLTPDNLGAPWLNFEAGAVSNTLWSANVCTYLFNVTSSDITGPLIQFQGTVATSKEENWKLVATINGAQEDGALDQGRLEKAFNTYWPELETALNKISEAKLPHLAKRSLEDIAEETLNIVRDLQKQSVRPLDKPVTATAPLAGVENFYLLSKLAGLQHDDPITGETINDTATLYGTTRRMTPPPSPLSPLIPPRKSDKPKEK